MGALTTPHNPAALSGDPMERTAQPITREDLDQRCYNPANHRAALIHAPVMAPLATTALISSVF